MINVWVALIMVGAGFVYGFSYSGMQAASAAAPPAVVCTSSPTATFNVTADIEDFAFSPVTLNVVIGVNNTVQWSNQGASTHTVTSALFGSASLAPGAKFTCTFNQPGTYSYHCIFHPVMVADVVVGGTAVSTSTTSTTTTTTATAFTGAAPTKIPVGVVAYVPIRIDNTQPIATVKNYNQRLVVNSSRFAPFEASDLRNIKFFTKTAGPVASWLESGNSSSSNSSVYWLKVPVAIKPLGNLTIYMGFGSLKSNFFNTVSVGEAPQLSSPYGRYDDGKGVFSFYDNFKTSNTAWAANLTGGGSVTRNNGLTVNFGSAPGYFATKKAFGVKTSFDALVTSFGAGDNLGYIAIPGALHNSGNGKPNWAGDFIRSDCGKVFPDQWNKTGDANPCGTVNGFFQNSTSGRGGVYSVDALTLRTSRQSVDYSAGNTTQPIAGNYPKFPARVGFTNQGGSVDVQWARVRVNPPDGVMPTGVFGAPRVLISIKGQGLLAGGPFFEPSTVIVPEGTIVVWSNKDGAAHTVTSTVMAFNSGTLFRFQTFSFTFTHMGVYEYRCLFHPSMQGTINVYHG